jgi:hypothetical protein
VWSHTEKVKEGCIAGTIGLLIDDADDNNVSF